MNKSAIILKILAIIINVILILLAVPAAIINHCSGVDLMMTIFVVITAILSIVILSFSRWLMTGTGGIVLVCLASILNGLSLIAVIAAISHYGMPPDIISNMAVIALLIFPFITLSALFIVRARLKKGMPCDMITCPNCGTEIQR